MSFNINPNTVYYLLIYVIILVVRFFKIHHSVKNQEEGTNRRHYWFVGLELVYYSVGIIILLMSSAPQWASVTITAYIVLLLVSAFLDAQGPEFAEGKRLWANLAIIAVVATFSTVFNQTLLFPKPPQGIGAQDKAAAVTREYRVAIPYSDYSLRRYLGDRLGDRMLVFVTTVTAPGRNEAVAAARRQFWDEKNESIAPFDPKRPKTPQNIAVDDDRIVAEVKT